MAYSPPARSEKARKVIEYRGDRTTWDIALDRPASDPDNPHHTFFFETSDGTVIDANVRGNAARWINHSCDANCESFEYDDGRVFIEARRTIRAGDEITYDYRLSLDGRISKRTRADYACHCGAAKCRGLLLVLRKKQKKTRERKRRRREALTAPERDGASATAAPKQQNARSTPRVRGPSTRRSAAPVTPCAQAFRQPPWPQATRAGRTARASARWSRRFGTMTIGAFR